MASKVITKWLNEGCARFDDPHNSRAVVQTAPRDLELRELPVPEIGPEDTLLQVEACGIGGSDYEQYPNSVRPEPVEGPSASPSCPAF